MPETHMASALFGLWGILEKNGYDPADIFRQVGLSPLKMSKPGSRYPVADVVRLWQKVSTLLGDTCFGLQGEDYYHPSHLGALGYAFLVSHTLRVAWERMVRYHKVVTDLKIMKVEDRAEGLSFILDFKDPTHSVPARNDAIIASIMAMSRINYPGALSPVSVKFSHHQPECYHKYFEYFRGPVFFNQPEDCLTLSKEAIDLILPGANQQLAELNDQVMISYLEGLKKNNIVNQVKALIVDLLPSGNVTDEMVAEKLCMSSRSLQRQMKKAGQTFNNLLNEIRLDLAKQYVSDHDMSLTEIAFMLGFSESSSFSRAFRRWTGDSPSVYRNGLSNS